MILKKTSLFPLLLLMMFSCSKKNADTVKHTNDLIHETSPYLLQHAHNPVDWKAWNQKTLELAKKENKLIIISIGYSACHWCHVMEEESFENDSIASLMNKDFINIKVDREERPDVDDVYMNAVQLMTGSGGWPLNCIALPDGRPFFGGTYFPKEQWSEVLTQISELYKNNPDSAIEFANNLTKGIQQTTLIPLQESKTNINPSEIMSAVTKWQENFDLEYGGEKRTIKFPMPNSLDFLMRYAYQFDNEQIQKHVQNTLTQMAYGGLYDQINGGFSRYSTDKKWHIPHFEKMLYDNAQLVSLYSKSYQLSKNLYYETIIEETLSFIANELTSPKGAFYSSLDADSKDVSGDTEEGAYYYWTKQELEKLITTDFDLFEAYYHINDYGLWENNKYVLIKTTSDKEFCKKNKLTESEFSIMLKDWKKVLQKARKNKVKPNLDDKVLTSWNALMIKGYTDAYKALGHKDYLETAISNANFILNNQLKNNGELYRNYKNGKSSINAFSEDYATLIEAFISLYEVSLDEKWLLQSKKLMDYCLDNFFNDENKMFYFKSSSDQQLVSKQIKVVDNVIASSNSILANCLFKLSLYYAETEYHKISNQMLSNVYKQVLESPSGYSNWLHLMLNFSNPFYEVVIAGEKSNQLNKELNNEYLPNVIVAGTKSPSSSLPLLKNKFMENETSIFVCNMGSCKLPQKNLGKALELIEK